MLRLIGDRPGVRAGDLADELGRERLAFKADVRKLKALGLTESLEVGYRLSPEAGQTADARAARCARDPSDARDQRRARRRARRRSQRRLASSSQVTASARRSVVAT